MRVIILIACILAVAMSTTMNTYAEDQKIKFNYDIHEGSPIGLYMEGELDPRNENMNKIQTFLRLAGKYIPVLESLAGKNTELKWERVWHIVFAGVKVDIYGWFQLIVGWRVNPGGYTTSQFDVEYIPFVYGGTYGRVNGTSTFAVGSTEAGLRYALAYAPIALQLFQSGKVCFQGTYTVEPVHFRQHLYAALTECHDEILSDLIDGHATFHWTCNLTMPANLTLFDVNFTDRYVGSIVPQTCVQF